MNMNYGTNPPKRPRLDTSAQRHVPQNNRPGFAHCNDEVWGDDDITAEEFDFLQSQVETQVTSRIIGEQNLREALCPVGLLGSTPTSVDGDQGGQLDVSNFGYPDISKVQTQMTKYEQEIKEMQERQDAREGKLKMLEVELFQKTAELDQERLQKLKLLDEHLEEHKQQVKEMNKSIKSLETELQFKEQEVMSAKGRIQLLEQQLAQKIHFQGAGDQPSSPFPKRQKVAVKREMNGLPSFSRHDFDDFKRSPSISKSIQTEQEETGNKGIKSKMVLQKVQNYDGISLASAISSLMISHQNHETLEDKFWHCPGDHHCSNHSQSSLSRSPESRSCHVCSSFSSKLKFSNSFRHLCTSVSHVVMYCNSQKQQHDCKKQASLCGVELELLPHINSCLAEYLEIANALSSRSGIGFRSPHSSPEQSSLRSTTAEENCALAFQVRNTCFVALSLLNKLFLCSSCVKWALLSENENCSEAQMISFIDMNATLDVNMDEQESKTSSKLVANVLSIIHVCSQMQSIKESAVLEEALNLLCGVLLNSSKGFPDVLEKINFGRLASGRYGLHVSKITVDILCLLTSSSVFPLLMGKCSESSVLQGLANAFSFIQTEEEQEPSLTLLTLNIEFLILALNTYSPFELHNCSSCWSELIQSLINALYQEMQTDFPKPSSPRLACLHKGVMLLFYLSTRLLVLFKTYRAKAEETYVCLICGLTQLCRIYGLRSSLEIIQDLWDFGMDDTGEFEMEGVTQPG